MINLVFLVAVAAGLGAKHRPHSPIPSRQLQNGITMKILQLICLLCVSEAVAAGAFSFTDYAPAIPADAIYVDPSVSATHAERVQGLVNAAPEGQAFVFKAGTHFLGELSPKHNQQFYGQIVNGQLATILTGAATIAPGRFSYDPANKVYKLAGQTQSDKMTAVMPGADGKPTPMTLRPQERVSFRYDVLKNNKFLRHATLGTDWTDHTPRDFARLGPGSFFFDYDNDTIYLKDNPDDANAMIEPEKCMNCDEIREFPRKTGCPVG